MMQNSGDTAMFKTYLEDGIQLKLYRTVNKREHFSFREFVAYLGSIDLWHCDIHHRIQMHESERKKLIEPNYIVKLENSFDFEAYGYDIDLIP